MKSGDLINVNTNAKLLNKLLGTDYKQWYKSTCLYGYDTMVWMACLDGQVRGGFKNFKQGERIIEQYIGPAGKLPDSFDLGWKVLKRLVFEKIPYCNSHYYVFLGVYKLENDENNHWRRTLVKVSDEFHFPHLMQ